jgi:hypothetical protein
VTKNINIPTIEELLAKQIKQWFEYNSPKILIEAVVNLLQRFPLFNEFLVETNMNMKYHIRFIDKLHHIYWNVKMIEKIKV